MAPPTGASLLSFPNRKGKPFASPASERCKPRSLQRAWSPSTSTSKPTQRCILSRTTTPRRLQNSKSLCTRLHADVTTQRELLAASQAEAKALKHSAETYKEELWENRSAAEEAMVEAASLQKRSLEMQISKMRSSLCQTSEELVLKTEELEKRGAKKQSSRRPQPRLKKLQDAQIATFNDTISSLTQTNSHLDAKVKRLNSEMEGLRAKLEEEMELRKTAQAKVAEKTMFLNAMQTHMEESERKKSEHEGLLSDNSSLKKEIVSLQSQLEENRRQSLELDLAVTRKVEEASTFMEDLKNTQECCTKLQKENATLKKQNKKYIKLADGVSPCSEDRAGGKADACTSTNEEVALGTNPYVEIARLIDRVKELEAAVASASSSTSTCTSRACEERGDNNQEARSTASPSPVSFERSEPTSRATLPVAPVSEETRPRPPCYYEFVSPDTSSPRRPGGQTLQCEASPSGSGTKASSRKTGQGLPVCHRTLRSNRRIRRIRCTLLTLRTFRAFPFRSTSPPARSRRSTHSPPSFLLPSTTRRRCRTPRPTSVSTALLLQQEPH